MFNQLVVSCARGKTRKPWFVAASLLAESALLGILILVPLIYTEALPAKMISLVLLSPPPPAAPAAPLFESILQ